MATEIFKIVKNPAIDFLFLIIDNDDVPTKQDSYKPIDAKFVNENGIEENLKNFYMQNPDKDSIKRFNNFLHNQIGNTFQDNIITKNHNVEVGISFLVTPKRFKEVDVDNLAKTLLDALKGIAFEDDSQVTNLICFKSIHPMKNNGLAIAITKLSEERMGLTQGMYFYSHDTIIEKE